MRKILAVKAVGSTGLLKDSMALAKPATEQPEPISVYTEMVSINPVFISEAALTEQRLPLIQELHASTALAVGSYVV